MAALSPEDRALLEPHLEFVTFKERFVLETPNRPIEYVYFLEHGVASVVAVNPDDTRIEVGVIGYEGVTGLSLILGDLRAANSTYVQLAGDGHRISAAALRSAMEASPSLHRVLLKYVLAFLVQTAQSALANGRAKLEVRLARWMLMAHDRMTTDAIPLTHEFLSIMLGVRRAGVTVALHAFERAGLVGMKRGEITVRDRAGLEKLAGSFYGMPEAELNRLLGTVVARERPIAMPLAAAT